MSVTYEEAYKRAWAYVTNKLNTIQSIYQHTTPPTGLSISRNGNRITFSWKIGDTRKYGDGQQLRYRINSETWIAVSVGNGATSASITIDPLKYYPNTKKKIKSISFSVRGNVKKYSEKLSYSVDYQVTDKKTKKTTKKTYTANGSVAINPPWSDWTEKTITFNIPKTPVVSSSVSDTHSNRTTFSWTTDTSAEDTKPFVRNQWETVLVKDSNISDGEKIKKYGGGGTTGKTGSTEQTENSTLLADGHSYTRWIRVRSGGWAGDSEWKYIRHVYAQPNKAAGVTAKASVTASGGFNCYAEWKTSASVSRPIDKIAVQYAITMPESNLSCPAGASWSDGIDLAYKNGADAGRFSIDDTLSEDQCLFIRVNTEYDAIYNSNYGKTFGTPVLTAVGKLKNPTGLSVEPDSSTHKAVISAGNPAQGDIDDAFLAIIYKDPGRSGDQFVIGVIPSGEESTIVQCPTWSDADAIAFGVYAVVGQYAKQTRADGADAYVIQPYAGKPLMQSDEVWEGGEVPLAPTGVAVEPTNVKGSVRVSWDWSWDGATGAEIAWADHEDAWESTSEPGSYIVSNLRTGAWNVAGLSLGTTWYFRVRFIKETADTTSYSPWSELTPNTMIDLSSPPETPILVLSDSFVIEGGEFTASWAYVSADGTAQSTAEICEATITGTDVGDGSTETTIVYGQNIASVSTEQRVLLNTSDLGWEPGSIHHLCLRVTSTSGRTSEQWSTPVSITVVERLECTIANTSLTEENILTQMPIDISVSGGDETSVFSVAIERLQSYYMDRPDETRFEGHEGETVALASQAADGSFSFEVEDLIGVIDDGALYRIVATIRDGYGQEASDSLDFSVHWEHQAIMPEARTAVFDDQIVLIKVERPEGALGTDMCDIYRLSADRPELIMTGVPLDGIYVDPYPAIGALGGHRIVYRTENNDYITDENVPAWVDLGRNTGGYLDGDQAVIDFNGQRVILRYNTDLSSSWEKDFKETRYLGGSVQGDWNPSISRKSNVSSVMLSVDDQEMIQAMRQLADYPGQCYVRTQDGSAYAADIQVSENRSHKTGGKIVEFSLEITKVESEEFKGLPSEEWKQSGHDSGVVAYFEDGADAVLKDLVCRIDPLENMGAISSLTLYISQTDEGEPQTILLPESVHAGYVDLIDGRLYAYQYYDSYAGEELAGRWISDSDEYEPGKSPTLGAKVISLDDAATEYDMEPQEIRSLHGVNYIWCDTGEIDVTYLVDPETYFEDQ